MLSERIRRRTYNRWEEARQDVFDYVEMIYNPVRKQVRNGMLPPVETAAEFESARRLEN
jgi:putative transposase